MNSPAPGFGLIAAAAGKDAHVDPLAGIPTVDEPLKVPGLQRLEVHGTDLAAVTEPNLVAAHPRPHPVAGRTRDSPPPDRPPERGEYSPDRHGTPGARAAAAPADPAGRT